MSRIVVALFSLLLVPQAGISSDDDVKQELRRLKGDWNLVRSVREGEEIPRERLRGSSFTFRGDQMIPARDPNDLTTISVDPKANPKTIDMKDRSGNLTLGIYRIEKNVLTMCVARSGVPRPEKFEATAGSKRYLIEMKRKPN